MAPNPNECCVILQQAATAAAAQQQQHQIIKIVTTSSDDASSDDGEHFYDASSDVGGATITQQQQQHVGTAMIGKTAVDSGVDVGDSGEDGAGHFDVPDEQLSAQIVEQVEYYFSDAHILKDAFLLKHARRNRDGFISLKLITSFKKVKHVTKDWRVVAYACRAQSKALEVNDAGTKVRRVAPLPVEDETSPSRTIVAMGLGAEKQSIESIAEMFGGCAGSIALIRILRPGNAIPPDVRQCANRHPDILTSVCAVVEFEAASTAREALAMTEPQLAEGVRLVELASRRGGGSNRTSPNSSRPVTPSPPSLSSSAAASASNTPRRKRRGVQQQQQQMSPTEHHQHDYPRSSPFLLRRHYDGLSSSNSSTPSHSPQPRRHHLMASALNRKPQQQQHTTAVGDQHPSSPVMIIMAPPRPKSSSCSEVVVTSASSGGSPPSSTASAGSHSPWVMRRRLELESGRSSPADNRLSLPSNIVRMPNGPDGTRGFHRCQAKPRSASAPEAPLSNMAAMMMISAM